MGEMGLHKTNIKISFYSNINLMMCVAFFKKNL